MKVRRISDPDSVAEVEAAFWQRVEKAPGDGCWLWIGTRQKRNGSPSYGLFSLGTRSRRMLAHRASWQFVNQRELQTSEAVCHRCDNPTCVRPDHLFVGSQADNLADMRAKGRGCNPVTNRGAAHHCAKIDERKVAEIRAMRLTGVSLAKIGKAFGLDPSTVHDIVRGRTWREA